MIEAILTVDCYRAEQCLLDELAKVARPRIRALIRAHAWTRAVDRSPSLYDPAEVIPARSPASKPTQLAWVHGIWINHRRGMILSADDRSALWAAVEASPNSQAGLSLTLQVLDVRDILSRG
jgi:hypothetical protein